MKHQSDAAPEKSVRTLRVGEQVRHILSEILHRGDGHDDVLSKHMGSVTEIRTCAYLCIENVRELVAPQGQGRWR